MNYSTIFLICQVIFNFYKTFIFNYSIAKVNSTPIWNLILQNLPVYIVEFTYSENSLYLLHKYGCILPRQ